MSNRHWNHGSFLLDYQNKVEEEPSTGHMINHVSTVTVLVWFHFVYTFRWVHVLNSSRCMNFGSYISKKTERSNLYPHPLWLTKTVRMIPLNNSKFHFTRSVRKSSFHVVIWLHVVFESLFWLRVTLCLRSLKRKVCLEHLRIKK